MSRKNHQMIDGRLLQTDKKYKALKSRQSERISQWMWQSYSSFRDRYKRMPNQSDAMLIVDAVYEKIEAATIWIPYDEVYHHFLKKMNRYCKRYDTEHAEHAEHEVKEAEHATTG